MHTVPSERVARAIAPVRCGPRAALTGRQLVHPRQLLGPREEVAPVGGEGGGVNAPDRILAERLAQAEQVARPWVARVVAAVPLRIVTNEECDVMPPANLPE